MGTIRLSDEWMPMEVVLGVVGAWAGLHRWKSKAAPATAITAQHKAAAQRGARDLPCWILTMVPDTARTQHNRTHNNTTAVSSTTAPPPSYAYIPVYLQISTLHLVNTCSVRRYLHCTVCPTAPQVQVQSRQLSPWRQRRALLQVCSMMHQGGGWGPPLLRTRRRASFLSELCIPRVGQMGSI